MKLPPSLEVTLLEPQVSPRCPSVCCFNRTCPAPVQRAAETLWMDSTLTTDNFRRGCYRYGHLAELLTSTVGLLEPPLDADGLREVLTERLSFADPVPDPPRVTAKTDVDALALQEKVLKLRDADRHRREAAAKAAYDAAHPQQEMGL